MSCGLTEEELAALEAEPAFRRSAYTTKQNDQPCNGTACADGGTCGTSSSCVQDAQTNKPSSSWVREELRTRSSMCMKCKAVSAVVLVRQREPLCKACLEAGVSGKVRALKTHKLLLPNDHIAVAFSGGHSSLALLANVLPMRKDATTQRKERGKIAFKLTAIHIDEAAAYGLSASEAADHIAAVQTAVRRCGATAAADDVAVVVVPLADVFLCDEIDGRENSCPAARHCHAPSSSSQTPPPVPSLQSKVQPKPQPSQQQELQQRVARLRALLQSVSDPTGREDLMRYLRCRLLSATAARLGASKLLSGESATTLAARVIADTAKGRGYPLPGDIQLVDARGVAAGGPALLYPMREVTIKETVFFCRLRGLSSAKLPVPVGGGGGGKTHRGRSINSLAAAFVEGLQANLPSTIFTILRTASALRPFPFNSTDSIAPASEANHLEAGQAAAAAVAPAANGDSAPARAGTSSVSVSGLEAGLRGAAGPLGSRALGGGVQQVAWCALCRASLSQREREAIAAAVAARDASGGDARRLGSNGAVKVGSAQRGAETGASAAEGSGRGGVVTSGSCGALEGRLESSEAAMVCAMVDGDGEERDDEDVDACAPFCFSCRSQILFTPGHFASVSDREHVGANLMDSESAVLPLLPVVFRSSR